MSRVPFANVGAESGAYAPVTAAPQGRAARHPASPAPVLRLARAFEELVEDPPWEWLERAVGLVPWLSTDAAVSEALARRVPYAAAAPAIVRVVHDKAFAVRVARDKDLDPGVADLAVILEPDELSPARIFAIADEWPRWAWRSFTVKPRWGTSGRGRSSGKDGRLAPPRGRVFSPSGVVVEPWLDRAMDLSSLWHVDVHGEPHLLGVTQPKMRAAGVYLGCDVVVPEGGAFARTPVAGTRWDEPVVDKARVVVEAAAAAGYRGPCGVDAFVWRDDDGALHLRGAVELNARFTAGHVALGLVQARGPAPGARFRFRLDVDEMLEELR